MPERESCRTGASLGLQREGMRQHGRAGAQAGLRAQKLPLLPPCRQRNTCLPDTEALTGQQNPRPVLHPHSHRRTGDSPRELRTRWWGSWGPLGQRVCSKSLSPGLSLPNLGPTSQSLWAGAELEPTLPPTSDKWGNRLTRLTKAMLFHSRPSPPLPSFQMLQTHGSSL